MAGGGGGDFVGNVITYIMGSKEKVEYFSLRKTLILSWKYKKYNPLNIHYPLHPQHIKQLFNMETFINVNASVHGQVCSVCAHG